MIKDCITCWYSDECIEGKKYNLIEEIENFDNVSRLYFNSFYKKAIRPNIILPINLKILEISEHNLGVMPILPDSLERLHCSGNKLIELPKLPPRLKNLVCDGNNLKELPELPETLETLSCVFNELKCLPRLPIGIKTIFCYHNNLEHLPDNIIQCRNLTYIVYKHGNPIELTIQQANFINTILNRNIRRYNKSDLYTSDKQNIHNSAVQKSLMESITNLMNNK